MKNILPPMVRLRRTKLGFPAPEREWAERIITDNMPWCIEVVSHAKDYVDLGGFQNLCQHILKKNHNEDIELFWRILLLSKWLSLLELG
jgi:hypothetical protein